MVDVPGWPSPRIRSDGNLQRITASESTSHRRWVEAYSGGRRGVAAAGPEPKRPMGWKRRTALPIVRKGMGPSANRRG